MFHTDQRRQLRVKIETKECDMPQDELSRIDDPLNRLADITAELPGDLDLTIVHHPHREQFHVKATLGLPRRTLFTGDWDAYLDTALNRSLRKLTHMAQAYQEEPEHGTDEIATKVEQMNREIVAPQDPDMASLGVAAADGDYQAFRKLLGGHEDWLRLRIGRWLQRYPDAEAEVGRRIKIGDLVEEVLLNAFERYGERSNDVPLHDWLDGLIDPSLQTYCRNPVEERENISLARTLLNTPPSPPRPSTKATSKKSRPAAKKKIPRPTAKKKSAAPARKKRKAQARKSAKPALARKKAGKTAAKKKKPAAKKKTAKRKKR